MNVLNLLTNVYGRLHNYKHIPFWVLTPFRKIVRGIANFILPLYLARTTPKTKDGKEGIIVSFTSFPARIKDVWKVVKSLKNQTIRPEHIILWLSQEQFPKRESIPQSLLECEDRIFEIRIVEGDIRSHKKYYYAMRDFPDKVIVTCDDDIYYHKDMIQNLIKTSRIFPHCIIANTTKQLRFDQNGELIPYQEWNDMITPLSHDNLVQIGEGGVLYPPHSLSNLVFRQDLIRELAPFADDLWLNLMARLNRTKIVQSVCVTLPLPIKSTAPRLTSINNGTTNMNDIQIHRMRNWLRKEGLDDVYSIHYNS